MVRLVGLAITTVLMAFQLWYTQAPSHQRALVPGWVRGGANVAAHAMLEAADTVGDAFGPSLRRGWNEARMAVGVMARPEAPRRGMMATGQDLSHRSFKAERLDEATLLGATLTGADFTKAFLVRAMLDGATGEGAVFEGAVMENASLRTARLPGARFARADLTAAQGQGADLTGADFTGAVLGRAQLSAASLRGASLRDAKMGRAVLYGTDLSGADLTGATGLYQPQLDAACGDAATKLPQGLSVPPCEEPGTTLAAGVDERSG